MKYLGGKFSSPANSAEYVDGWERTFGDRAKQDEMNDIAECVECGLEVAMDDGCWQPGQFCLFGMLFCCSLACGEQYAAREAAPGYRPGEPNFECVEVAPASEVTPSR
jgi:hypothetical protein